MCVWTLVIHEVGFTQFIYNKIDWHIYNTNIYKANGSHLYFLCRMERKFAQNV